MRVVLGLAALLLLVPTAAACDGLSPGDELLTEDGQCTLAFLVADPNGLYFATAGHCIREGQTANNPDAGDFGVGVMRHLVPDTGQPTDGEPGEDFGLIRVNPEFHAKLNPKMCGWGGPTGIYDETPGGGNVRHYGYGLVFGDVGPATRQREGVNLVNEDNFAFYWTGDGLPGDSGSAVVSEDGRALGVLTHLRVNPWTNGGTHLLRGFDLAKERGFHLRLVLEGEDPVEVLRSLQAHAPSGGETQPPVTATPTPPADEGGNDGGAPANETEPSPASDNETATTTTPPTDAPGDELQTARADDGRAVPAPGLALVLVAALAAALRASRAKR